MNTSTNRPGRSSSKGPRRRTFLKSKRKPRNGGFKGDNKRGVRAGGTRGGRRIPTFDPSQFINKNPIEKTEEVYEPKNTFDTFGLNKKLVGIVKSLGIETPTPIQDQIIPEIMSGKDVIALAETGTGKTAAFLLPLIEKTLKNHAEQTLVLAPTRELALQIEEELRKLTKGFKLYSVVCVGGANIRPQIKALRKHQNFIIGTPGRILDLIEHKNFDPAQVTKVVLDEADRMLDMGFINDIRKILKRTPDNRETLLFSATIQEATMQLVNEFLKDPVTVSVKKRDITNNIEQDIVPFKEDSKFQTLIELLKSDDFSKVIIFGAMKHKVQKLSRQLKDNNIEAEAIHGNKTHSQRQRSLKKFKNHEARVLVATDVAARGIHVEDVTHVINYDLPSTFEDYVHRIGRTGRSTKHGKALTFVKK